MAKITNKEIKDFIEEKYSEHIEYDGIKIERFEKFGSDKIDIKVISYGRKIGWFEGFNDETLFKNMENHFNWQFSVG